MHIKFQVLLVHLKSHNIAYFVYRKPDIALLGVQLEIVIFNATDIQCVLNNILQMVRRIHHDFKVIHDFLPHRKGNGREDVLDHFQDGDNRVERRSQFMGDRREEVGSYLLLSCLHLLDPCDVCAENNELGTLVNEPSLYLDKLLGIFLFEKCLSVMFVLICGRLYICP